MRKVGEINNCEKCGSSYGKYNENFDSDFSEYWCELPAVERGGEKLKKKGLCQFCNPKSVFYNKSVVNA